MIWMMVIVGYAVVDIIKQIRYDGAVVLKLWKLIFR